LHALTLAIKQICGHNFRNSNNTNAEAAAAGFGLLSARMSVLAKKKRLFSTNLFALKIYCYAATSGTSGEIQAGKKGASNACPTIYGIAAIVANCKCCGKQVN